MSLYYLSKAYITNIVVHDMCRHHYYFDVCVWINFIEAPYHYMYHDDMKRTD